jgi:hypothetical protein
MDLFFILLLLMARLPDFAHNCGVPSKPTVRIRTSQRREGEKLHQWQRGGLEILLLFTNSSSSSADVLYPPSAPLFDVTYLFTLEEKHGGSVGSDWERP